MGRSEHDCAKSRCEKPLIPPRITAEQAREFAKDWERVAEAIRQFGKVAAEAARGMQDVLEEYKRDANEEEE